VTIADEPNMKTIPRAEVTGLTKAQTPVQIVVLIAVSIITVVGALTVACLWLTRWLGSRAMKVERTMLAAFLVAMPLVYVKGWFAARDHAASSWIWVELLGLALFAAFAALGLKNSPWFLAIGIAGHGFAWDLWHYKNAAYIPAWYAVACMLVDLALGAHVAARIPAYRQA
jgi:hypothetical protein